MFLIFESGIFNGGKAGLIATHFTIIPSRCIFNAINYAHDTPIPNIDKVIVTVKNVINWNRPAKKEDFTGNVFL